MNVTFWDSHNILKSLSKKKEKTLYVESAVFGRLTKYISTLAFKSLKY